MGTQRNTVQRQIILEALKKLNAHPSIGDIYAEIHSANPSISITTVYRNLRQLAASGTIRQVTLPDGLEKYDMRVDQHYHFTCKDCGSVIDIDIGYLGGINETVEAKYGLRVDGHEVVFLGICDRCRMHENPEGDKALNKPTKGRTPNNTQGGNA